MEITTVEMITRVALALILGSILGLERNLAGKGGGMRTYAMVSLGSSAFVLISQLVRTPALVSENPLALAPAIISGIGFIGAGLVLFQAQMHKVTGLTTAAGLWVSAGVGMAIGYGLFNLAIITTVAALIVFTLFWFIEKTILKFSYRKDGNEEN
jgi:putative Mg2+ transporter-C (MgtC) family protein